MTKSKKVHISLVVFALVLSLVLAFCILFTSLPMTASAGQVVDTLLAAWQFSTMGLQNGTSLNGFSFKASYVASGTVSDLYPVDVDVFFKLDRATGITNPAYYDNGSKLRVYNGNTITVTIPDGYIFDYIYFLDPEVNSFSFVSITDGWSFPANTTNITMFYNAKSISNELVLGIGQDNLRVDYIAIGFHVDTEYVNRYIWEVNKQGYTFGSAINSINVPLPDDNNLHIEFGGNSPMTRPSYDGTSLFLPISASPYFTVPYDTVISKIIFTSPTEVDVSSYESFSVNLNENGDNGRFYKGDDNSVVWEGVLLPGAEFKIFLKSAVRWTSVEVLYGNDEYGYDQGYYNGFSEGYDEGVTDGYDVGYQLGKQAGINEANSTVNDTSASYTAGYNKGSNDAGNYTFFSLISSVIDVPVQAFTSLFNFDVLGVNLSGFFASLLAICLVIIVVKFALGRM